MLDGFELQEARIAAAERYADIGRKLIAEVGVAEADVIVSSGLTGWVKFSEPLQFKAPWPATTRKRLYVVAHECGHVALHKPPRRSKPVYKIEFEAEQYAIEALRRHGVAVPKCMVEAGRGYVARKIARARRRGAKFIEPKILAWAYAARPETLHKWRAL